jgi:flagellar L-ring protein precursor FlgH
MKALGLAAACVCAVWAAAPAAGDSLWNKAGTKATAVHADDVARKVGDNLTIVILEETKIDNTTNRSMEKKNDNTAKWEGTVSGGFAGGVKNKVYNLPGAELTGTSDHKFDGKADYNTDRAFSDQITVVVEDVLPNGNLVVLGKREREVAGDKQSVQVAGIVRPSDIAFDNTILSQKVANFQITFKTKGEENRYTTPGWLSRLMNLLNPN